MKRIEALLVQSPSGNKTIDVYLRNPDTGRVLHEDMDTFMFRTVLPHEERLEVRHITCDDERFQDNLNYLRSIPLDTFKDYPRYSDAFKEMYEVSGGYYSPKTPCPMENREVDEYIIQSAVIFPCLDGNGKIYKQTMWLAPRHSQCFSRAAVARLNYNKERVRQGFWTDQGRFLDRYEAKKLALANGQLKQNTEYAELYSEDLW